jgi:hypothetical protein
MIRRLTEKPATALAAWPSVNQKQPIAFPSPLPFDGRGEGQGEVRVQGDEFQLFVTRFV